MKPKPTAHTSIRMKPSTTTRTTADHQPDFQPMPINAPHENEKISVNSSRWRLNASASPRRGWGSMAATMREG